MTDRSDGAAVLVRPLRLAEVRGAYPLVRQLHPDLSVETFYGRLEAIERDSTFLGAYAGDTLVGLAVVRTVTTLGRGAHAYLDDLVVDAAHRSGGVGARLLAALEADARGRGLSVLRLHARPDAASFYARAGYAPSSSTYVLKAL